MPDDAWSRYGRALTAAMSEVLDELPEVARPHALETADYWLSLGIVMGLEHPVPARRLLHLVEAEEHERAALLDDATAFLDEALP